MTTTTCYPNKQDAKSCLQVFHRIDGRLVVLGISEDRASLAPLANGHELLYSSSNCSGPAYMGLQHHYLLFATTFHYRGTQFHYNAEDAPAEVEFASYENSNIVASSQPECVAAFGPLSTFIPPDRCCRPKAQGQSTCTCVPALLGDTASFTPPFHVEGP